MSNLQGSLHFPEAFCLVMTLIQFTVPVTVGKVDDDPDGEPDSRTNVGGLGKLGHHSQAGQARENRQNRVERHFEAAPVADVFPVPQGDNPERYQGEGK